MSDGIRAHMAGAEMQWFILTDELSVDDAQASGRWLKSDAVVEVRR